MKMNWFVINGILGNDNKEKDISGYKMLWMPFQVKVKAPTLYAAQLLVEGVYGSENIHIDIDNSYILLDDINL